MHRSIPFFFVIFELSRSLRLCERHLVQVEIVVVAELLALGLQDFHVDLADTRFTQLEVLADLLHRFAFDVVSDQDRLLFLAQAAQNKFQHFKPLHVVGGALFVRRGHLVDVRGALAVFIFAAGVDRNNATGTEALDQNFVLLGRKLHVCCDFFFGRFAMQRLGKIL